MTGNNNWCDPIAFAIDAIVEDILQLSDDELLSEVRARGDDPTKIAHANRAEVFKLVGVYRRKQLSDARDAIAADQLNHRKSASDDPAAARMRLNSIISRFPATEAKLTLAARKGKALSDNDVLSMLADLDELGISGEDGK